MIIEKEVQEDDQTVTVQTCLDKNKYLDKKGAQEFVEQFKRFVDTKVLGEQ